MGLSDLRVVGSMHERKALMSELSEGFIALPGGIGTMEEFFEVLTWAQLGVHGKPCGFLEVRGFWQPLLAAVDRMRDEGFLAADHAAMLVVFDQMVSQGFLSAEHRSMILVETEPIRLVEAFAHYRPPEVVKWIDRSET